MNKKECINECMEMIESGAEMIEIYEWVEENTDLDPAEITDEIYKREVLR